MPIIDDVKRGLGKSWAMALGYVPIAFAVGATSLAAGLSPANTMWLSILVFAGSSQLAATQLFAMGASPASVILTVFIVNSRHLLMSSALANYLRGLGRVRLAAFCFQLCDEAFAVHAGGMRRATTPRPATLFTVNLALYLAWVAGTASAIVFSAPIATMWRFGLDFAPAGMFIALLALLVHDRTQAWVALLAGCTATALHCVGFGAWSVLVATVMCASLGTWSQSWTRKRSSLLSSA